MTIDKLIDQLDGLNNPEHKTKIGVIENPISVVNNVFVQWLEFIEKNLPPDSGGQHWGRSLDLALDKSVELFDQHKESLPDIIKDEEYFHILKIVPKGYLNYIGLFYTGLLNVGREERELIVPDNLTKVNFWGYRLSKGKIILTQTEETSRLGYGLCGIGQEATGGVIINSSIVTGLGTSAKEGLFINHGTMTNGFGTFAAGGIFINRGLIRGNDGVALWGGIYFDYGNVENPYYIVPKNSYKTKSTIVLSNKSNFHWGTSESEKKYCFTDESLQKDNYLLSWFNEIGQLTAKGVNIDKQRIETIVQQIKTHCKNKYGYK